MANRLLRVLALMAMTVSLLVAAQAPAQAETPSWQSKKFTLADGRVFHASVPMCGGVPCATPRQLFIYSHGINGPETALQVNLWLSSHRGKDPDAIWAYAISTGDKAWNAGDDYCCTWDGRDDVQYLVNIRDHLAGIHAVDLERVGLYGHSNGGMLSAKATCERPDVFPVAVEFAGTPSPTLPCDLDAVRIAQWHGSADTVVPLNGGWATVREHTFWIPPAADLGTRVLPESTFALNVVQGEDHTPSGAITTAMIQWLNAQLP